MSRTTGTTVSDLSQTLPLFDDSKQLSSRRWIEELERAQQLASWSDDTLRTIAQGKLRGTTRNWHLSCDDAFPTWPSWRTAFLRQFSDDMALIKWQGKVSERQQSKNETLHAYTFAKLRILARCPVVLTDKQRIEYLLQGIRDNHLVSAIAVQRPATVDGFVEIATALDNTSVLIKRARSDRSSGFQEDGSHSTPPGMSSSPATSFYEKNTGLSQPRHGHVPRRQRNKSLPSEEQDARYEALSKKYAVAVFRPCQNLEESVCFHCRHKGHLASKCPTKPSTTAPTAATTPALHSGPSEAFEGTQVVCPCDGQHCWCRSS